MRPLTLRGRLTLLVAIGATLVTAVLTGGFNLVLRSSLDDDADRVVRSRAESALETVAVDSDGTPRLIEAPAAQDAGVGIWVFGSDAASDILERPPAPAAIQRIADSLAGTDERFAESEQFDSRLYSMAVRRPDGEQVGTVVASLSLEPYERTAEGALIASLVFAALALIGIVLVSRLLVDRSLRPVARMTREATDWSEHDLDHRFGAGEPTDELTELAAAFDSMLDRLASSLRHEQRLTAEISHELRTPLAAILAETELALARGRNEREDELALGRIAERATELRRILETLLAASRAEGAPGHAGAIVASVADRVLRGAAPLAQSQGIRISRSEPFDESAAVDVEEALLERIIAPLVENGCRYASSVVEVAVEATAAGVLITVVDDGPGVAPEERERIFEPGMRGSAAAGSGGGLGLALSRRLAVAAGGGLGLAKGASATGASFELRLPAAIR